MHLLFLHTNFPAQFGQIATQFAKLHGHRCTFVSEKQVTDTAEIQHVQFQSRGGARQETHYCTRSFENQVWRSHAAFEALQQRPEIKPDVIIAHSGFVSSIFLRELYQDTPHIGYFEYFYHAHHSDMDFRQDLPMPTQLDSLRVRLRNAQLLLDLHNCEAGYSPTNFQRAQIPPEFQSKLQTIFDGIDVDFWSPRRPTTRTFNGTTIPEDHKIVTYVSRGFEATRGFDIFLQVANQICRVRKDVSVIVVGEDRVAYGGDQRYTAGKSFMQWSIDKHNPNLERIHFVGRLPPSQLVELLSLSDLHLYLTVPFVLSWSLLNAMSCGCKILASDTAPVREMIEHGKTGLLTDFFDVNAWTEMSLEVLNNPQQYARCAEAARNKIILNYQLQHAVSKLHSLVQSVV